ncbi:MAG TPA: hypothetical protein VJU54_09585 [Nitrospiraceae bacterium]|nr:hypothetical protein [Nitrospiraceae bacterium]
MVSVPKVIYLVFCGVLLSFGPSTVAQTEISAQRQGGQGVGETPLHQMESAPSATSKTIIQGEVIAVKGDDCVLKDQDGKEVRLQIDLPLLKAANIEPGDRIEATVNDQNHVLSFRRGGHGSPK